MNNIVSKVVTAINESHATGKPEALALMNLYTTIGQVIAGQDDTSIVSELTKAIAKDCSEVKGFSARNLRRMRDFYVTYSTDETLMAEAKTIGWTQNTVIMESCSSLEEMAFYIALVKEEGLSKVALMTAMESNAFETAKRKKLMEKTSAVVSKSKETTCTPVAPVSHSSQNASKDTIGNVTKNVSPPVANVKPFLRGSSPPRNRWRVFERYLQSKSLSLFISRFREMFSPSSQNRHLEIDVYCGWSHCLQI